MVCLLRYSQFEMRVLTSITYMGFSLVQIFHDTFFLVRLPFEAPEIVDDMPVDSMGLYSALGDPLCAKC